MEIIENDVSIQPERQVKFHINFMNGQVYKSRICAVSAADTDRSLLTGM